MLPNIGWQYCEAVKMSLLHVFVPGGGVLAVSLLFATSPTPKRVCGTGLHLSTRQCVHDRVSLFGRQGTFSQLFKYLTNSSQLIPSHP